MTTKQKIIYIYFILLPFIDVITSLLTRFTSSYISLGMIVKSLTGIFCIFYVIFLSKSKYRKFTMYYFIFLLLYVILYFITKINVLSFKNMFNEFNYFFHYWYYPTMIMGIFNIFDDQDISKQFIEKILICNCIIYTALLLVPYFTGTSFNSYRWHNVYGFNGWFYSANETGPITILLLSSILFFLDNDRKIKILVIVPILLSISLIGTKVSYLGMIIVTIIVMLLFILKTKKERFILPIFLIIILVVISNLSPTIYNLKHRIDLLDYEEEVVDKEYKYEDIGDVIKNKQFADIIRVTLNGRESFLLKNYSIYDESRVIDKLLGIGWNDREDINYNVKKKLIEIDYLDIIIHYGILGFIIYFIPLGYLSIRLLKKKTKKEPEFWLYLIILMLELFISSFAGHVLSSPSVAIYLILIMYMIKLNAIESNC